MSNVRRQECVLFRVEQHPKTEQHAEILRWLEDEDRKSGEGFYCNRNVITRCFNESRLHCLTEEQQVVAFAVFKKYGVGSEIGILEVHPASRGRGLGTILATHLFGHLRGLGATSVEVECAPESSEIFWRAMGFKNMPNAERHSAISLHRSLLT